MEKYSRVITLSGREFRASETMADIFLAHAADITSRGLTELVPLLHEGGVDLLLVGPTTRIEVRIVGPVAVPDIARAGVSAVSAA
jgi:hypothetical protein